MKRGSMLVGLGLVLALAMAGCGGGGGGGGGGSPTAAATTAVAAGQVAPEIKAASWLNGGTAVTLTGLGKGAVVFFSSTTCGNCTTALPTVAALRTSHPGAVFVSLMADDAAAATTYVAAHPELTWSLGVGSTSYSDYGVTGIPHFYVIGSAGTVLHEGHSTTDLAAALTTHQF